MKAPPIRVPVEKLISRVVIFFSLDRERAKAKTPINDIRDIIETAIIDFRMGSIFISYLFWSGLGSWF